MKNLLLKIAVLTLTVCLSLLSFGCGESDGGETVQTTGEYKYRLATGTRDVLDEEGEIVKEEDGSNKTESYKYYIITGFEVSSEDALKMAEGDYSTVEKYRVLGTETNALPKTGRDLGEDNDYPVEEIASGAFTNQIIFTDITIGDHIKTIGEGAFAGCTNLNSLTLPFIGKSIDATGAESLFGHVFGASATGDKNVEVKAKICERKDDAGASIIPEGSLDITFTVPSSLKTVNLGSTKIETIPECAFYGMSMLKNVIIPETVVDIQSHAFYGCTGLTFFNLHKVKTIYQNAFNGCSSLKTIDFGEVEVIEKYAFAGCSKLGENRFEEDEAKLTITLPATLKELGKNAFRGCSNAKYFNIENTQIEVIDNSVFADCLNLVKVTLKNNLTIKAGAFANCNKLDEEVMTQMVKTKSNVKVEVGAFAFEIK